MLSSLFLLSSRAESCTNGAWSQCAGDGFTGQTCCPDGTDCQRASQWWSACVDHCPDGWECASGPTPEPTPNPTMPPIEPDDCPNEAWEQCGGEGFTGWTCCQTGQTCVVGNAHWSSCQEAEADPTPEPTMAPVDPTPEPTMAPTLPPVPTAEPTPNPTFDSSYSMDEFECTQVEWTWTLAGHWSNIWQGEVAFTAPEPGAWVLVLEAPEDLDITSVAWWDGDEPTRLSDQAFLLDPTDAWWNNIEDISFLMNFEGFDPLDNLALHYCMVPVDFSLYLSSETDHDVAASVIGIVGLLAQSMWESGGDAPWSACDENNYTDSPTASCTQRDDGQLYTEVQSSVGCFVDLSMTMTAETSASWATLGPMECKPSTATEESVTEGCCWWGRGAIQTTGPHNYGVLQRDVVSTMGLNEPNGDPVDLCLNPEAMCQQEDLKCVGAAYYWTTVVQNEACFFPTLDAYIESGFDVTATATDCTHSFASGIGGSVNNGIWNSDAHENAKRVVNFETLMTPVKNALNAFTLGSTDTSGVFACSGNEVVDYILETSDLGAVSGIDDATSVYTWEGFCTALRQMNTI